MSKLSYNELQEIINNKMGTYSDMLSEKVINSLNTVREGRATKSFLTSNYGQKVVRLDAVLEEFSEQFDLETPETIYSLILPDKYEDIRNEFSKEKTIEAQMKYYGNKLFVAHNYHQLQTLVAGHLYKGLELEDKWERCHTEHRGCQSYCGNCNLYLRYGRPAIWVYVFGEPEAICLCDPANGHPLTQETIDEWYELSDVSDEYFEEKAREELKHSGNALMLTETPWLGYPTLNAFRKACGSWERFMDIVDMTIDSINSEGIWDVEMTTSTVRREGSHLFETTKAENGSTALSPKRMVYVENPKVRTRYEELPIDRLKLFLSLTFYKYAGFQPMRPVVEVSCGDGYTDYVVNDGSIGDDEGRGTSLLVTSSEAVGTFKFTINYFNK